MQSLRTVFSLPLAIGWSLLGSTVACHESTAPSEVVAVHGASAAVVQKQRSTVDTVMFNDCTGEDIALRGTSHVIFATTESGDGGLHQAFALNIVLSGTGLLTGSRYRSVSTSTFTFNVSGAHAGQTSTGSSRLLRQGSGGDLFVHFLQHITVDALGNIRVSHTDFRFECV